MECRIADNERQLLYMVCTRARNFLHVSVMKPESGFLRNSVPETGVSRARSL